MGQPAPWEYPGCSKPATPVMEKITWFHNLLLVIITVITLFVLALLVIVWCSSTRKANPVPARTTHNTLSRWSGRGAGADPGFIAILSFRLLFLARHAEARPDGEGDRQPVVLGL